MAVSLTSRPPKGFSNEIWDNICEIPCTSVLLRWISQQLVDQDIGNICDLLSLTKKPSLKTSSDWRVYSEILSTWLTERISVGTTYMSDLILPLSVLKIKTLNAKSLWKKVADLCYLGDEFHYHDAVGHATSGIRSDSGIGGSTIYRSPKDPSVTHVECTEFSGVFDAPIQEEETTLAILSEMVTGDWQHSQHSRQQPSLIQLVCDNLARNRSSVEQLRVFLTQRCVDTHNDIPHFSSFMIDIAKKATFEEIFVFLSRIGAWHFLNYSILKDIFVHFRSISSQLRLQIREYDDEIEEFKQETLLMDFLAVWGGRCDKDEELPCCRPIIVKSIGDPNSFTIADACDMAGLIAGEFSLNELGALASGFSGSMYIKWMAPPAVTKHILKVMRHKKRPDLLQFGVLQLAVERTVFKSKYRYESIYKLSLNNPRLFWGGVGAKELIWRKHSREVFTHNKETGEFHWFRGAQLNVSENCLDEHVKCHPDKVALVWERDDEKTERVTYKQLLDQTCRVANVLKKRGINKGDVVVICMPTMPLAVASMLACARIGAVHCMLFPDFNDEVLGQRIKEVGARAVITADVRVIGGETSNLREKVRKALNKKETSVQIVLFAKRSDSSPASITIEVTDDSSHCDDVTDRVQYYSLETEMQQESSHCDPVAMDSEDTLFIVYTSGTEKGTSKAVYHTQAGYLLYTKLTHKFMFNLAPDDIMGCVSDLGWIAAHCYVVYGPLSNGNTTLLFESIATHPNEGRYWKTVEKLKLTHFYTIPSVLKELRIRANKTGAGIGQVEKYDLSSLKVIAIGGEPIPPDMEKWYYTKVGMGKCLFIDNWGQTELGGVGLVRWKAPEDKKRADFPVSKSFAVFGVEWNKDKEGAMYLKHPLPAMGKFVQSGDLMKKPYERDYYSKDNGGYSTSDILEESQKQFRVMGRKDRTLLVKGVWLSLADIEEQLRIQMTDENVVQVTIILQESSDKSGCSYVHVVLQTPLAVNYKHRELYKLTISTPPMAKIIAEKSFEPKVYILPLTESMKGCLKTISKKTCHIKLKTFLISRNQRSPSPPINSAESKVTGQGCEVFEEKELREFFQYE